MQRVQRVLDSLLHFSDTLISEDHFEFLIVRLTILKRFKRSKGYQYHPDTFGLFYFSDFFPPSSEDAIEYFMCLRIKVRLF